jgi:hypothetical protein
MSTYINLIEVMQVLPLVILALVLCLIFKPLLRGVARAALLVIKPKLSKEERLQRRQMRDAMLLKRMLNAVDGSPSHVAELRAMAARG